MSSGTGMRVLVTAGAEKQCLAAVRSLGRAGAWVEVAAAKPDAPAFRSRWCRAAHLLPGGGQAALRDFLVARMRASRYTTVLPCDDESARALSEARDELALYTALALPSRDSFDRATDKAALVRLAEEIGIPVPRSLHPRTLAEATTMAAELRFPLIVKGHGGWGAQHVRLVRSPDDLLPQVEEVAALEAGLGSGLPMLQEFVRGTGVGFSTLFRHGEPRAFFVHRRLAEFEIGSKDVPYSCPVAESVRDPEVESLGLRLFSRLGWHGLGMAEWRRETGTGRTVLMEINPRLVGSTDLALRAGVDLPLLACRMVRDGDVEPVLAFREGVRLRWLLPDGLRDVLARPGQLLDATAWSAATDWSWGDLAPHWLQLRRTIWALRHGQ